MAQLIESPERAIRLARHIAQDIASYNRDQVELSIAQDSLFADLAEEIEQGRDLYRARVSPALDRSTNFYDRALVDELMRDKAHVRSRIW